MLLVSADDSYDPAKPEACWERLMAQKVFALGFCTPTTVKYVPPAEKRQIPLVGLFTGAQTLHTPLRHSVINVRASYFDETREQVDGLLKTLHYRKLGVIYPGDAFGEAVPQGVETALKANGASLEGFVDAIVVVEGLKRASKEPTREGLIRGIESLHDFEIGLGAELKLDYSARTTRDPIARF